MASDPEAASNAPASIALVLGALILGLALALIGLTPPGARAADAPTEVFSAGRAYEHLVAVFGEEPVPHPSGSRAIEEVRARLRARLEALGYAPQSRAEVRCNRWGICAEIVNLWAVREGAGDDVLLLVAHYDSVAAGPGVADDGAGVAALLEVARLVAAAPPSKNDVAFLFTDGEELGLLGAEAFVQHNPLARRVKMVINLEARGTSGPSMMFETGGPSAPLARCLAALDRPVTSSLFSSVYRRLPNDTDFSVFRAAGHAGFNFAFIGGLESYHTAHDDLAHLSRDSLQHQGDNLWQLSEALMNAELALAGGEASYFDVAGRFLLRWPLSWSPYLAFVAMALVAAQIALAFRREERFFAHFVRLTGAALATMLIAGGIAYGVYVLLVGRVASAAPYHPHPALGVAAVALAVLAVGAALAAWVGRTPASRASTCAGWSAWALFGLVIAQRLPEAAHLLIAPTLLAGVAGLVAPRFGGWRGVALAALPLLLATILWGRVAIALIDAVGLVAVLAAGPISALVVVVAFPGLVPLRALRRRRIALYGAAAAGPLVFAAAFAWPSFGPDRSQRLSIAYYRAPAGAQWWVDASWGAPPAEVAQAGSLGEAGTTPLPLAALLRAAVGPAPDVDLARPSLERDGDAYRIRTRRGGWLTMLLLPPELSHRRVTVAGVEVPQYLLASPVFPRFRLVAFAGAEAPMTIEGEGEILVLEATPGLPPAAEPLLRARGDRGLPWGYGDLTIVASPASLGAPP